MFHVMDWLLHGHVLDFLQFNSNVLRVMGYILLFIKVKYVKSLLFIHNEVQQLLFIDNEVQ